MADKVKIDENNAEAPMGDGKVKKPRLKKYNQQEEPLKVNLAKEEPAAEEQVEEQPKEETQEEQPVVEEVVEETKKKRLLKKVSSQL